MPAIIHEEQHRAPVVVLPSRTEMTSSPLSTAATLPSEGVPEITDDDSDDSSSDDSSVSLLDHSDAESTDENVAWEEAHSHLDAATTIGEQEMEYVVLYDEEASSDEV